jgi:hypothetical protein
MKVSNKKFKKDSLKTGSHPYFSSTKLQISVADPDLSIINSKKDLDFY